MLLRTIRCIALAAVTGCARGDTSSPADTVSSGIELRDTSEYTGQVSDGTLAHLHRDGAFVDSVDLDFDVWAVGRDSLVFLPVRAYTVEGDAGGVEIERHVLLAGDERVVIDTLLPYFDSGFSSPVVMGRQLVYWGMRPLAPAGNYELYAMRYAFGSGRLDSLSLGRVGLYTDARFHLPPPTMDGGSVVFRGDSATFVVDSAFGDVERRPRS